MQPVNCSVACHNCDKLGGCVSGQTLRKLEMLEKEIKERKQMMDRRSSQRYGRVG